jgi:hypothetical protein
MRCITLLTDFGCRDAYVGILKGVIARLNSAVSIIDLTHQIPPQDILAARFNLLNSYAYFPSGTVHLVVVDPGVGTHRRAIAVEFGRGFLVGPDNGVLSGVVQQEAASGVVELTNPRYWLTSTPSSTFHGRDIFAPVAAYLARGVPLHDLGRPLDQSTLITPDLPPAQLTDEGGSGVIQYIDHYGNLITNIPAPAWEHWTASVQTSTGQSFALETQPTYGAAAPGTLLALVGSHGWIEIAINGGSAAQYLEAQIGDPVKLVGESIE